MFEPSEEQFLQNIRENPNDLYNLGVYSDWLEEQGSSQADVIRLFDRARKGSDSAIDQLFEFIGDFYDIAERLSRDYRIMAAIDFIWRYQEVASHRLAIQLLQRCWWYAEGRYPIDHIYLTIQRLANQGIHDVLHNLAHYLTSPEVAVEIAEDIAVFVGPESRAQMYDTQYLIVASYQLFQSNILPGSFESSGYVEKVIE